MLLPEPGRGRRPPGTERPAGTAASAASAVWGPRAAEVRRAWTGRRTWPRTLALTAPRAADLLISEPRERARCDRCRRQGCRRTSDGRGRRGPDASAASISAPSPSTSSATWAGGIERGAALERGLGGRGVVQEAEVDHGLEAVRVGPVGIEGDGLVEHQRRFTNLLRRPVLGQLDGGQPADVGLGFHVVRIGQRDLRGTARTPRPGPCPAGRGPGPGGCSCPR